RDVVLGDHVLRRDVHRDRAQVDADRLLDPRDHVNDPRPARRDDRPSRKTTERSYSRRILSPLIRNATRMAIAAHAPSIAASLQRFSGRAPRAGLRCPGLAAPRIEFIAWASQKDKGRAKGASAATTLAGREHLKGGGAPRRGPPLPQKSSAPCGIDGVAAGFSSFGFSAT